MSLLSGIRFVPKEERTNQESDSDDSSTDSAKLKHHKKKHKHHKSDSSKQKKKKKDKEKEKKRKFNDLKSRHSSSSSSKGNDKRGRDADASPSFDHEAEIQNMQSMVDSEGLVMESKKSKSNIDFEKYNLYDNNNNRGSMINYSKLAFENNPPSSSDEEEVDEEGYGKTSRVNDSNSGRNRFNDTDNGRDQYAGSRSGGSGGGSSSPTRSSQYTSRSNIGSTSTSTVHPSPSSSAPSAPPPPPPLASNQSMAAILRARLQKGEKLVTMTAPVPPAPYGNGRGRSNHNSNSNDNNSSSRSSQRNNHSQDKKDDVDIASFMSVGELKWMSAFKLKEKQGTTTSSSSGSNGGSGSSGIPIIPGEKACSLQDLVAMEKSGGGLTGGAGDIDKIFAENIIKRGSGYRGSELGLGSGMGASRGSGGDRAGMDEEEGMGMTSWLGTEADVDSDDNNEDDDGGKKKKQNKSKSNPVPSKNMIEKMKKKEKERVNGVDMTMFQQKEDNMNDKQIYDRIVQKALAKKKAYSQTVSNCPRCVSGRRFRPELVLCSGSYFQLRLKSRQDSLVPGWHCELVPLVHASSVLLAEKEGDGECVVSEGRGVADGGLFKELERFKSCLQRMFERMGKGVVFTETATRSGVSRHHTTVDVFPVAKDAEGEVHMSFKQAFRDSGDAFSTHKRRIVPTHNVTKPFHHSVPSHFPYMLVEWSEAEGNGGQVGLLYILDAAISINDTELDKEDTGEFGTGFCVDVMAGVLEIDLLERRLMRQRGGSGREVAEREKEDVRCFQQEWTVFDWTAYDYA